MSDATEHETRSATDPDRGVSELLIGALSGSVLLPFVQAVTTKAAEDVYQLVRSKLTRKGRRATEAEIRDSGTVTLVDPGSRLVLVLPATVSPTMAARLDQVRLPTHRTGWLRVSWDAQRAQWLVLPCDEPPPAQHTLD
ncbi:hypothetical protein [Nocardia blacklockiae]|uniref:hypothetical protein n=1 Tax=Nocardia blacklockiae TaxID=480036 RepID=UPI00189490C7|nr:hypothetical protein [Nocardia blacklockiae]MBF6171309.1 hypothetical protein [Nocardia blacklockiae]